MAEDANAAVTTGLFMFFTTYMFCHGIDCRDGSK